MHGKLFGRIYLWAGKRKGRRKGGREREKYPPSLGGLYTKNIKGVRFEYIVRFDLYYTLKRQKKDT